MIERKLAKCGDFDFGLEDRGLPVLFGFFEYDSGSQGLGRQVDVGFITAFLRAIGVNRLNEVRGRSCWVTVQDGMISMIEPLHKKDGEVFDILAYHKSAGGA